MFKMGPKNNFTFLLPAFSVGLQDGINPCGFASALILLLFLARVGRTRNRIFWFGLIFLLFSIMTDYGLNIGMFDLLLMYPSATVLIRGVYFLVTAAFVVLGGINIFDRFQYQKYFNPRLFKCATPAFLRNTGEGSGARKEGAIVSVGWGLLAAGIGAFTALLSSIYPQLEYIYIVHSYYLAGGERAFAQESFIQYSIASGLPPFLVWLAVLFLWEMRGRQRVVLYYKGISAALFLAVAIGLGYFLLR